MKKRVKKLWLDALYSGKYKQARSHLQTNDGGFCCLGVLCDLAAKEGIGEWDGRVFLTKAYTYGGVDREENYLPKAVCEWAGIKDKGGGNFTDGKYATKPEEYINLAHANDNGYTHEELAGVIEGCWEEL